MSNYTAAGCSKHATLTANTVDTVTLDAAYPLVEVINRDASADIYFTVDRGDTNPTTLTPTIGGDGCYYVAPKGKCVIVDDQRRQGQAASKVRIISAAAAPYSVTGYTTT